MTSFVKRLSMMLGFMIIAGSIALTLILCSSSAQPPESFTFHPTEERGEEFYDDTHNLKDYGIWNPAPVYGGGNAAPIPHPQEKSF